MRLIVIILALLFSCNFQLFAQTDSSEFDEPIDWNKPSDDEKSRMGIVMGLQMSTLLGTSLPDNKLMVGVLGGGYGRYNFKYGFSVQPQFQVSFRGSNFSAGPGEIRALRLLYLDFPLLFTKKLSKKSKHKIGGGIQYSRLINTVMFLDKLDYPSGVAPKLDKNDWCPALIYQYQYEYFALQIAAKYGLRSTNLGYDWPENGKPLNNKGSLNNASIELNIIF